MKAVIKSLVMFFAWLVLGLGFSIAHAKNKSKTTDDSEKVQKDFKFSPLDINGRYQNSGAIEARVENEKVLQDLLTPRADFKDRVRADVKRR